MKQLILKYSLSIILPFVLVTNFFAQNCDQIIADNRMLKGIQLLTTQQFTLIIRGTYSYSIEFINDELGITAKMFSKGGVQFNRDDEIIFMDANRNRKSYRFINMNVIEKQGNTPVHQNILQLDLAAIKWFANASIHTFYIKNNTSNQMRKMTVNPNRQADLMKQANCFLQYLDEGGIREVNLTTSNRPTTRTITQSGDPISATTPTSIRTTDISQLNDEELAQLQRELVETKRKLRAEIEAERKKTERNKKHPSSRSGSCSTASNRKKSCLC